MLGYTVPEGVMLLNSTARFVAEKVDDDREFNADGCEPELGIQRSTACSRLA